LQFLHQIFNVSQWRRNKFESGGTGPERSAVKFCFWSCPSTFWL